MTKTPCDPVPIPHPSAHAAPVLPGSHHRRPGPPPRALFKLQGSSVLAISGGDLTKWKGDAIVNAANERMLGGGGVDGAIHRAAGSQLMDACYEVPPVSKSGYVRCPTGEARITPGFRLDAKFVIHTVGPIYESSEESAPLLRSAIKNSLMLCKEKGLKSIAFPAISCGVYGYPPHEAAEVAIDTMLEFSDGIDLIEFVLFGRDTFDPFISVAAEKLEVVEQGADREADEPSLPSSTKAESETEDGDAANVAAKPSLPGGEGASATTGECTGPTAATSEGDSTTVEPMSQEESLGTLGSVGAAGEEPTSQQNESGGPIKGADSTNDAEPMSQSGEEEDAASEKLEETTSSGIGHGVEQGMPGKKRAQPGADGGQTADDDVPGSDQGTAMETANACKAAGASEEGPAQDGSVVSGTCDPSAAAEGPSA
ncbi:unnamed protein product [Scytosiphon promiscuus]